MIKFKNIEHPPPYASRYYYLDISEYINEINRYLGNKEFKDRYTTQFEWFCENIPHAKKVLNIGCGHGRETLALMWKLGATDILGIDNDSAKIAVANHMAQVISNFIELIRKAQLELNNDEFTIWYRNIPEAYRYYFKPQFVSMDISDISSSSRIELAPKFDTIYCRFVLHLIYDESIDKLIQGIKLMKQIIQPETGRLIVVEPSIKGEKEYKFSHYFKELGFTLVNDPPTDKYSLGLVICPETNPFGYIYQLL